MEIYNHRIAAKPKIEGDSFLVEPYIDNQPHDWATSSDYYLKLPLN